MNPTNQPSAFDLFSGMGGLTLGLKWAGFNVLGAVEIDHLTVETYKLNHPRTKVWNTDIRLLHPDEVMRDLGLMKGDLALLAGCPPCQGYSTLRTKQRGRSVDDDRNDLVFEFLRFVRAMEPQAIMMENVPNLAKDARIEIFLERLSLMGYSVDDAVQVLDAADYHVPQRRRRMILLSGRQGAVPFANPCPDRLDVESAFALLERSRQVPDPLHDYVVARSDRVRRMIQHVPHDGGSRSDLPEDLQLACHRRADGFRDVYGRMAWKRVAPTITSGCFNPSKGRFLHPVEDRAITLREAAVLQSFPSDYQISLRCGREAAAAMIGNALPPEFIRRHAEAVKHYWEQSQGAR